MLFVVWAAEGKTGLLFGAFIIGCRNSQMLVFHFGNYRGGALAKLPFNVAALGIEPGSHDRSGSSAHHP